MGWCLFDEIADEETKLHEFEVCIEYLDCKYCEYFASDLDEYYSMLAFYHASDKDEYNSMLEFLEHNPDS